MPVTFETPGHAVRFGHIHYGHVIDGAVATEATDAPVHMGRVVIIDVIDRAMEPDPLNRLARLPTAPDRLKLRIIFLHLLMTRHAGLRVRHVGLRRNIDKIGKILWRFQMSKWLRLHALPKQCALIL